MKRSIIWLVVLAAITVLARPVPAAAQQRSGRGPQGRQGYGFYEQPSYGYGYGVLVPQFRESPHDAEVRRIRAYHSRYRVRTHPRTLVPSPPSPYDYFGW